MMGSKEDIALKKRSSPFYHHFFTHPFQIPWKKAGCFTVGYFQNE